MPDNKTTQTEPSTLDKILRIEDRLEGIKGDIFGLMDNYISDLIHLHVLRDLLGEDMVTDAFPEKD
jgi:hypothetical protein